jgi:hydroxypyruvate isomerase
VVPKIRRGGYVFLSWVGDHSPRHVHVYRDRRLIVKWDLDHHQAMQGQITTRIRRLIEELVEEGKL